MLQSALMRRGCQTQLPLLRHRCLAHGRLFREVPANPQMKEQTQPRVAHSLYDHGLLDGFKSSLPVLKHFKSFSALFCTFMSFYVIFCTFVSLCGKWFCRILYFCKREQEELSGVGLRRVHVQRSFSARKSVENNE